MYNILYKIYTEDIGRQNPYVYTVYIYIYNYTYNI